MKKEILAAIVSIIAGFAFVPFGICLADSVSVSPSKVFSGDSIKISWSGGGAVNDTLQLKKYGSSQFPKIYINSCSTWTMGSTVKQSGSCDFVMDKSYGTGEFIFVLKATHQNPYSIRTYTETTNSNVFTVKCKSNCSVLNAKQCSDNGHQTCEDIDNDGCLEWGEVSACPSGQTCSGNGVCAVTCADECSATGSKQCSGNGYQTCGNHDADICLEWSAVSACPSGQACSGNGVCSQDGCEKNDRKQCYNGDVYWYDSCGNRGQVYEACAANEPCSNAVCGSGSNNQSTDLTAQINLLKQKIAELQQQLAALTSTASASANYVGTTCTRLTKYLYFGITDSEVYCLQDFLKKQGYAVVSNGFYDQATKAAVSQLQLKYAAQILAPHGLTIGSGNVGNDTRAKINQLMAAN